MLYYSIFSKQNALQIHTNQNYFQQVVLKDPLYIHISSVFYSWKTTATYSTIIKHYAHRISHSANTQLYISIPLNSLSVLSLRWTVFVGYLCRIGFIVRFYYHLSRPWRPGFIYMLSRSRCHSLRRRYMLYAL